MVIWSSLKLYSPEEFSWESTHCSMQPRVAYKPQNSLGKQLIKMSEEETNMFYQNLFCWTVELNWWIPKGKTQPIPISRPQNDLMAVTFLGLIFAVCTAGCFRCCYQKVIHLAAEHTLQQLCYYRNVCSRRVKGKTSAFREALYLPVCATEA